MDIIEIVKNFYDHEPVRAARWFSRLVSLRDKSKETDFILAYKYARVLDDLVDEGRDPYAVRDILRDQKENICKVMQGSSFDHSTMLDQILEHLNCSYGNQVLNIYLDLLTGFETDNEVVLTGMPLDQDALARRHITQTIPPFRILSSIVFGRDLDYSPAFEDMARTWATYDALIDIQEDLEGGLILFSAEELDTYGVRFEKGEPVPHSLGYLVDYKKKETVRDIFWKSSSVKDTNLPVFERSLLGLYFKSRSLKLLMRDCKPQNEIIYARNQCDFGCAERRES